MKTEKIQTSIAASSLFGSAGDTALRALADRMVTRRFGGDQFIFHAGEEASSMFLIAEGTVRIRVTSESGQAITLTELQPFECFGELSLLDGGKRSASAQAAGAVTLLELPREAFLQALQQDGEVLTSVLEALGSALRRVTEQASDMVFLDITARVAKLLVRLSEGETSGRAVEGLSQADIADMVGCSRQRVNIALKELAGRRYVQTSSKAITVLDLEGLRRRAQL